MDERRTTIPLFKVGMSPAVDKPLLETLHSGYIGEGQRVKEFERAIEAIVGNPVIAVNSCTAALTLAFRLTGVRPGLEVVSTPMTCTATNMAILAAGGEIIWADIDPRTGLIDPEDAERAVSIYTRALCCVDWGGTPCELDALKSVAKGYGLKLVEDAACSFGASFKGRPVGSVADFTCVLGSTSIITSTGKRRISDIRKGELILAEDGKYHFVADIHKNKYKGNWTRFYAGQARLSATDNHPIKIYRDYKDQWIPIKEIKEGDCVYVITKECPKCHQNIIPFYNNICMDCFIESDHSLEKIKKISLVKSKGKKYTSRLIHYKNHVFSQMDKYEKNGYRVIPIISAIPDFLAIKNGKIIAVEVESTSTIRNGKKNKYEKLGRYQYDDVIWITQEKTREAKRYNYQIIGQLARVPISRIHRGNWAGKTQSVYNLSVEENPTYFAQGILVHNCFSFQAIKHLTTVDGGALSVLDAGGRERGRLMRWFGIDRDCPGRDIRCEGDIHEWGYKFHMSDVTATIGLAQLAARVHEKAIAAARANAAWYDTEFLARGIKGVKPVHRRPGRDSTFWLYTVLCDRRDEFVAHLKSWRIAASQVHRRNDLFRCFRPYLDRRLPGVDEFSRRQCSIPVGWWLTEADRKYIMNAIEDFDRRMK